MISFSNENGKNYVSIFGKRVFVISEIGISLLPNVHLKPVRWSDIVNKPATGAELVHEQANGLVNGINKIFTVSVAFDNVYINGLLQLEPDHYVQTDSTTFELSDAPISGDIVTVTFIQ